MTIISLQEAPQIALKKDLLSHPIALAYCYLTYFHYLTSWAITYKDRPKTKNGWKHSKCTWVNFNTTQQGYQKLWSETLFHSHFIWQTFWVTHLLISLFTCANPEILKIWGKKLFIFRSYLILPLSRAWEALSTWKPLVYLQ